jgi:penicillin G amidase
VTRLAVVAVALAVGAWAMLPRQSALGALARRALSRIEGEIVVPHLRSPVRVVRDQWGVPHIAASSVDDLFFAQGYVVAQDRLWQMEVWRRTVEGRLAEIVGADAVERDRVARLLTYRGPVDDQELQVYHPEARRLMTAFVAGVNAFIAERKANLPVEFAITGVVPEPWTIETLTRRQIAFGDATSELQLARNVAAMGVAEANRLDNPDPWDDLTVPEGFNPAIVDATALGSTRIGSRTLRPALLPQYRSARASPPDSRPDAIRPGSNNWVVSGALSATGKPVVVNDPHREVSLPSLRYIVHLQAPGWNVIGATEPPFLSIAAGHNERLGWGLTIVGTDQHDVFVEALNPADPESVRWNGGWEPLRIVREEIKVKGGPAQTVVLKFSRHGPIFHEDRVRNVALALRSALHERGTAAYLSGLRLSQARSCRDFLEAATYWYAPSENLICGDVDGNISWRASALTPSRKGFTGRLPVPATGAFAWTGFRRDLPQQLNPASGFIATANHNVQPPGYAPPFMYKDADVRFERITRLKQLLKSDRKYSIEDHRRIQLDAYSLAAAADIPGFKTWTATDAAVERARALLAAWDGIYRRDAPEPALYEIWRRQPRTQTVFRDDKYGATQVPRDPNEALKRAVDQLVATQGPDPAKWRWGRMHARTFRHPLVREFDLPDVERGGGGETVAADGASFREILDVSNWDRSIATNTPGQSGQPGSPFYGNLLPLWANDEYFPLLFSSGAIEAHARHRLTLRPK